MEFAPLPGQIDDVKIGVPISHTSIVTRVGKTINAGNLTMMPHGATLRIQINDGKNVIAIKKMVNTSELIVLLIKNSG